MRVTEWEERQEGRKPMCRNDDNQQCLKFEEGNVQIQQVQQILIYV